MYRSSPYLSSQRSNNIPNDLGATFTDADADCAPGQLPADRHVSTERGDGSVSSSVTHQQIEVTSAQGEVNPDNEDGKLLDEETCSLLTDESTPEPESESGYESTSERSIVTCSQKDLISRLMNKISFSKGAMVHGSADGDPRTLSPPTIQTSIRPKGFHDNGSSISRGKRTRDDDEDPEDEDGGKRKRRRSKKSFSSDLPLAKVRYFACPFHKFDRSTYSDRNGNPELALKYRSLWPS